MLLENGLDDRLAFHISSLFVRAPVPVYEKELMFPSCIEESDEEQESPLQTKKKEQLSSQEEQNEEVGLTQSPREYLSEEQGIEFLDPKQNGSSSKQKKRDNKYNQKVEQNKLKVLSNKKQKNSEQALTSTTRSNIGNQNEVKAGVSTKWWVKCPPVDGVSHFENLQSTNWNSLRFKNPPTADSDIGWRVEFRPMDIQLTDFENTAYTVMVGMIANIVNTFDLDFVLPITLVDENMKRAHIRDGLSTAKFWWKIPTSAQQESGFTESDINETEFLSSNKKKM